MARARLRKGDVSLEELYEISKLYYRQKDDKKKRAKLDILSGTLQARKNYIYDRSKREWVQTGREVLFTFLTRTRPISYKKTDTIAIHKYPVYFLIRDVTMGIKSAVRFREGSLTAKPQFARPGMTAKVRLQIINSNIRKMIQLDHFFNVQWVANFNGLLYGPNFANRPPMKANTSMLPYLGKHALFVAEKILIPILTRAEGRAALQAKISI